MTLLRLSNQSLNSITTLPAADGTAVTGVIKTPATQPTNSMLYWDGTDYVSLTTGANNLYLGVNANKPTWELTPTPTLIAQSSWMDRSSSSTASGGVYYFGGQSYSICVFAAEANCDFHVHVNYFGEANTHDIHTKLQYQVGYGAWQDTKIGLYGQAGSMKLGSYPDSDYNSTPHNYSMMYADTSASMGVSAGNPVCFRMYHFNGGTFYHNRAINTAYESGISGITVTQTVGNTIWPRVTWY
jgi:hypothetical protein